MSSSSASSVLLKGDVVLGKGAETASEDEYKLWKVIYPNYIDKSKSVKEGRRVSAHKAIDRPTLADIVEALRFLNAPYVIENKAYPRDWLVRGRVRVNLSAISDDSMNTKLHLLWKLSSTISGLKSRHDRLAKEVAALQALEAKAAREAASTAKKTGKKK